MFTEIGEKTFLLKAHVHLMCLDVLIDLFPDAHFIFTYRKVSDIVGSYCSLTEKVSEKYVYFC